jgi:hypothetical protein
VETDEKFTKLRNEIAKIDWKSIFQAKNQLVNAKRSLDERMKEKSTESIRTAQLGKNVYKELWDKIKQGQKGAERLC